MLSIDTNILWHGFNADSPQHGAAYAWLQSVQALEAVAISEFILAEFYGLLRNPAVLKQPLGAADAAAVVEAKKPGTVQCYMQAAFRLASFQPDEEKYRSVLSDRKGESPVQQPLNTHKPFGYASRRPLLIGR